MAEMTGAHPDLDLLRQARAGDRSAYGQIVTRYQDRLYNAVLRLVGDPDEARELTQDTFMRGLQKIASFRSESSPYTWLFRIAVNLSISQLRKVRRRRTFSLDAPNGQRGQEPEDQATSLKGRIRDGGMTPPQTIEQREQNQQVLSALGRLDAEHRAVLVMRDIEEMDYQEMADILNVPLGTLKSRLFRARLALRDELKEYFK